MLYYLCFGRYCSRAHCAQFWRQLREAQRSFDSYSSSWQKQFSDRNRRVRIRVGNASDIPNVPMSTGLLRETLSHKTDGV